MISLLQGHFLAANWARLQRARAVPCVVKAVDTLSTGFKRAATFPSTVSVYKMIPKEALIHTQHASHQRCA